MPFEIQSELENNGTTLAVECPSSRCVFGTCEICEQTEPLDISFLPQLLFTKFLVLATIPNTRHWEHPTAGQANYQQPTIPMNRSPYSIDPYSPLDKWPPHDLPRQQSIEFGHANTRHSWEATRDQPSRYASKYDRHPNTLLPCRPCIPTAYPAEAPTGRVLVSKVAKCLFVYCPRQTTNLLSRCRNTRPRPTVWE
jgi:hypothetical protein